MIEWSDQGVVLEVRPHGETSALVVLLTELHGRHAGIVRGGTGRRLRGLLQPGNQVAAVWQARLSEHLGTLKVEALHLRAAALLDDPDRLAALVAATSVTELAVPEREPHPALYQALLALLDALLAEPLWAAVYVRYELGLLAELGYALDLSTCVATGTTEDLVFVSPRSGRSVCAEAGAPYRDKLLACPPFLTGQVGEEVTWTEIDDGLRLTGLFLERQVLLPLGRRMPAARTRFQDRIRRLANGSGVISRS